MRSVAIISHTQHYCDKNGEIVGFAKGGALEKYSLREEIRDENYGLGNTVFLESIADSLVNYVLFTNSFVWHFIYLFKHVVGHTA